MGRPLAQPVRASRKAAWKAAAAAACCGEGAAGRKSAARTSARCASLSCSGKRTSTQTKRVPCAAGVCHTPSFVCVLSCSCGGGTDCNAEEVDCDSYVYVCQGLCASPEGFNDHKQVALLAGVGTGCWLHCSSVDLVLISQVSSCPRSEECQRILCTYQFILPTS